MRWTDAVPASDAPALQSLVELAVAVGVDPDHAADVAGAIGTYCRARHGSEDLDRDYLLFLLTRSGFRLSSFEPLLVNHALFKALHHAPDAAALFEASRRRLVWAGPADVSAAGQAVYVDLRKVQIGEREDVLLVWARVFTKLVDWVCAWRQGNRELQAIHIEGRMGQGRDWDTARNQLEGTLRNREAALHLPAAELYWSG